MYIKLEIFQIKYINLDFMKCGYEVTRMILLQAYLCTYSMVTFKVTTLEQLCTKSKNTTTVGNIFGTPVVE
jgi:hypothetical protein